MQNNEEFNIFKLFSNEFCLIKKIKINLLLASKGGITRLLQCTNYWYTLYANRVISQLIGSYVQPQQYCSYFAQSNATWCDNHVKA